MRVNKSIVGNPLDKTHLVLVFNYVQYPCFELVYFRPRQWHMSQKQSFSTTVHHLSPQNGYTMYSSPHVLTTPPPIIPVGW